MICYLQCSQYSHCYSFDFPPALHSMKFLAVQLPYRAKNLSQYENKGDKSKREKKFEGEFEFCVLKHANVEQDIFQLESSNNDGVCISHLQINDKLVLVGQNNDQTSFWIDGDSHHCVNDAAMMSTMELSIKNGYACSSSCKGQIS